MPLLCCLLLTYLAAVAQMTGAAATGPIFLPALVLMLTVRWFPPFAAAIWAFALGVTLDALGTGPLGLQAAILVATAALLTRWGGEPGPQSGGKWMWIAFWTSAGIQILSTACELLPRQPWDRWEPLLVPQLISSAVTALLLSGIVATWRQLTGAPCTTH